MRRAKAGSRPNTAIVITVKAASPRVNCQRPSPGSPKPIETIGAFQFFQQSQPSSPTRMTPKEIAQARSGGHSLQILNARDAATESNLSREVGASALVSDSSNFINCQSAAAPSDLSNSGRLRAISNSVIR